MSGAVVQRATEHALRALLDAGVPPPDDSVEVLGSMVQGLVNAMLGDRAMLRLLVGNAGPLDDLVDALVGDAESWQAMRRWEAEHGPALYRAVVTALRAELALRRPS